MPTRVIARKRRVPGISFAWQIARENKSMFCEYNYGIFLSLQPEPKQPAAYGSSENKSSTVSPLMTTLLYLINLCLRCLLAPFFGINQPAALVIRARPATLFVAHTCLTPARSIHAPTLFNRSPS